MTKAQSLLEYTILIIIIVSAFLTMQVYIKRGFQGRWKQATDDLGDQYDKNTFNGTMKYVSSGFSESRTQAIAVNVNGVNGMMTTRMDTSALTETKKGSTRSEP